MLALVETSAQTHSPFRGWWEKKSRLPVIIYEGPENSGKTTIKRVVNELLFHESISFERWTGTHYAYSMLFSRSFDVEELVMMDFKMDQNFKVLLVFLYAPTTDLLSRKNLDPIDDKKYKLTRRQVDELMIHFNTWYHGSPFKNKMMIDTKARNKFEAADAIKMKVEAMKFE